MVFSIKYIESIEQKQIKVPKDLKEGIKNAIRRRQLPADVDVELAAEAINLMLVGYVLAVRKDKAFWTLNRYYRLVDACLISLVSIKRDMNSY